MAITDNASLLTAIAGWSNRTEFTSVIPDFVVATEAIFNYGDGEPADQDYIVPLRTREMVTLATSITIAAGIGTLPADFLEPIRALSSTSTPATLQYAPPDWYTENFPSGQSTSPKFYTIMGSSLYCGTSVVLDYYAKIGPLASGVNWLITKSPMAYLYGGLYHLYLYDKAGDQAATFRALMTGQIAGLQGNDVASRIVTPQRRAAMVVW